MDKDTALLMISKDLFIEAWKSVPDLHKHPNRPKGEPVDKLPELELVADKFVDFHKRLQSQLDK